MFAVILGPSQIIILLLLGLLLFGNRLPEISRSLAKALREFQNVWHGVIDDMTGALVPTQPAPLRTSPAVTTVLPDFSAANRVSPPA